MLILLPPSETKRDGGAPDTALDLAALRFPALTEPRTAVLDALGLLDEDPQVAARALKLGPTQSHELERNRAINRSPQLPAMDRYTGVLFDALDAQSLSVGAREFAGRHLVVHSALFGLVGALDPIPAYRLSHDSRLPGVSLQRTWRDAIAAELARETFVLDLRSESYVDMGPAPSQAAYVRVVSADGDGRRRALNHFNKKSKGLFTRALLEAGIEHSDAASLTAWAAGAGFDLTVADGGELELLVA
ncbi:peroxide stress protein YaaA [Cryobacterium sp. BB307]|uniref:YaaA family protein n=1 Tax=Cryobacterium sp. BB307 TaxID=2716317 RepID=UPI0014480B53|nr:peroxide stress protein YaaA [Cryobacterium sp. BB307]